MQTSDQTEQSRSWLTPGVLGIGLASLLADAGHEIPTALLPSFLTSTLGAPAAALGLIEGFADGAAGGARLFGGALADNPALRRRTATGGYIGTAVLGALIGLTGVVWQAGALRIAAWAARGIRVPSRNALLADITEPATYGRAYGFERAMDNLGAIVGPLLALGLVILVGARNAMLFSVIPGLLAAAAILYAIRQIPRPTIRGRQPLRLRVRPVMQGRLGKLLIGMGAFELGHAAATLMILRATTLLVPSAGRDGAVRLALVLYIGYNAVAAAASVPAGRAGDRFGAPLVLLLGVAGFLLAYVAFAVGGRSSSACFGVRDRRTGDRSRRDGPELRCRGASAHWGARFRLRPAGRGSGFRQSRCKRCRRHHLDRRLAVGCLRVLGRVDGRGHHRSQRRDQVSLTAANSATGR